MLIYAVKYFWNNLMLVVDIWVWNNIAIILIILIFLYPCFCKMLWCWNFLGTRWARWPLSKQLYRLRLQVLDKYSCLTTLYVVLLFCIDLSEKCWLWAATEETWYVVFSTTFHQAFLSHFLYKHLAVFKAAHLPKIIHKCI